MAEPECDFSRTCRTCRCETDQLNSLFAYFEKDGGNARIDEMLMACASVQISEDDGLPNTICETCTEQLNNAYNFKQQCELSERSFREITGNHSVENARENVKQEMLQQQIDNDYARNVKNEPGLDLYDLPPSEKCDFIEFLDNNQHLLTCRVCYKVFTTVEGLRCHKRLHSGIMFKCKVCDKEYTRQNHLTRHELTHIKRKVHICRICNKTLTRFEHLKRHLTIHLKEKPFACTICNRGFNRQEHWINHMGKCKGDRIHICDICNKGFNREDSLEVHRKMHDNKMPVLPTLENLNNIEQHYYQIDYNETIAFSDTSDNDNDGDTDDCFEPQVNIDVGEIQENAVLEEQKDVKQTVQEQDCSGDTEINEALNNEERENELSETKIQAEDDVDDTIADNYEPADDIADHESDSNDSDYVPFKPSPPKVKRGRGRPRKYALKPAKGSRPRGRPPARPKVELKEEEEAVEDDEGEFHCLDCKKVFHRSSALKKHRCDNEVQKIHSCDVCGKVFTRGNHLKRHMISHSTNKPHCCEICPKSFSRKDHLVQHLKLHNRAQDYECDVCKKPFTRADQLAKHKASKHNIGEKTMGEKKFKCTICMKCFTTEKYRDIHMKGHTGEKKFQCKTCEKSFLSKSHLTEHMKFHNDHSKKFLCSECGQRFIRNDYLVIHMRRHRGEKPFKCKFCGKGFPRTTDLTVHERYHTGEKTHLCTICGRGFGRAYNLTVHMRTHTGEKPYQCTYCDAAFAQGNDLKAHVRRHTGERFQCELCTETFLMGYLLTQHKRSVHGLNVVSNIRRLQPVNKIKQNPDDPPPITIPLPTPVVPSSVLTAQLQAQLAVAHLHNIVRE